MKKIIITTISILILLFAVKSFALPAFPWAEGMGAATIGGRNASATVYIVDTLSDNPADGVTFREACTASGSRYVVFEVSGVIDLTSNLVIDDPYITIAGQTSPGGIVLTGSQTNINTHDVIVTHMRFRLGATRVTAETAESYGDAIEIGAYTTSVGDPPAQYNIIFDHCSFSWGIDETVSAVCDTSDVTFSWCFFTNGLSTSVHPESPHSAGFIAWARYSQNLRVSLHHNFFGFNRFRNPENNYNSFIDSVNNVVYGHETTRTHEIGNQSGYTSYANLIGNYTRTTNSNSTSYGRTSYIIDYATSPNDRVYVTGNLDGTRTSQASAQWLVVQEYWHDATASTDWQAPEPYATTGYSGLGIPVTATTMDSTYAAYIVANAGATVPVRDGVDTTAATNYTNNTGTFTNSVAVDTIGEIETLVNLSSPAAVADTDNDGISDTWETSTFGDLDQTANTDYDSDGYSDLEEYLFELGGYQEGEESDTTSPTVSSVAINGSTATIVFNEAVVTTGYDTGDLDLDCSTAGNNIALSSPSGSGASRTFTSASAIDYGDTCNLDYTGSTDDVEDAAGNDLETFSDTAVTNNTPDTTDPAVTITTPTSDPTYNNGATNIITLEGTASDNDDVDHVTWSNDRGGSGTCTGTTSWSQANISLTSGDNVITITAYDNAENDKTDVITVTYTPLDPNVRTGGVGTTGARFQ